MQAAKLDHDLGLDERPHDDGVRRLHPARRRLALRDQGRPDPRRPARARRAPRPATARVEPGARDPARPPDVGRRAAACPGLREALGLDGRTRPRRRGRRGRGAGARPGRGRWRPPAGTRAAPPSSPVAAGDGRRAVERVLRFAADARSCPGWPRPPTRSPRVLHALDGGFIPAGPSRLAAARAGQRAARPAGTSTPSTPRPSRRGWPGRPGRRWPSRWSSATAPTHGDVPASRRAVACGARQRDAHRPATTSPRCSRCSASARSGTRRPGASPALEVITLAELGRPRIDVTVRICGFFRDAFPHVVALLDDAVRLVAALDEPAERNFVRAHAGPTAEHGDERRATTRIFGSKPGTYGAGLLPADRLPELARRRRPRRGLRHLGRLRLRPRAGRRPRARRRWRPPTGASPSRPRTPTPASTTSPTPTTTSSTTAA